MDFQPRAPLEISSILELLEQNSKKYPQKEAIISVEPHTLDFDSINYRDLKELSLRTAALLVSLGIKRGDRYAILMDNSVEVLLFELAGALIGATTVPLDIKRDTLERKLFKVKETNSKILFTNSNEKLPNIKTVSWKDFSKFKKLLPETGVKANNGLDTHYVILYTSGTTNLPKGVPLTIKACLLNAMGIATWQKMTDKEIFNIVLPLHHINSTIFCLSVLLKGGTIVLNKTYSSSKFWHVVSKFSCTNTSIVPTILHDLLARKDKFIKCPSLKKICIGSAPVLPEQTLKFYKTFKIRVTQGYGQTETALRVSGVPVDLPEKSYLKMLKSNSIGTELANNKLAIMDSENNHKKEGEHGEICIFGPTLGDGYLNDPEATKDSFKNGWFHSGDLGYYKGKYYFIIGRIKEIIIKGGINISPSAIEDALLKSYPEIKEVCVVGYPDLRMGEEIAAVIVIKEGYSKEELEKKILAGEGIKSLSKYDLPKKVVFFDSLPKTSTGKIQRVEVKNQINSSVRIIKPDETELLKKAVEINNEGFKDVPSTLEGFKNRAQNAILFGAFDSNGQLVGSLSCVQLNMRDLQNMKTWEEAATGNNPKGDTLVCIAISVKRHIKSEPVEGIVDEKLAKEKIEEYVHSGKDHVLNFHAKSKGGLAGATVWKILENGRKEDKESVGYNVLLKYPEINKKIIKTPSASPSIQLIEQALITAQEKGIKNVIAFSRPAGFRKYLLSLSGNWGLDAA